MHTSPLLSSLRTRTPRDPTRADLRTWLTLDLISVLASLLDIGGSLDWFTNVNANLINALRLVRTPEILTTKLHAYSASRFGVLTAASELLADVNLSYCDC